ncbi:MAG: hypothetical protein HY319_19775 [Armatimonadetes bacterium]|nr:hypothetical protein [Armatimonadota bacterium]
MSGLLERLRQAGQLDSVGQFTIDAEKARLKMGKFGLAEPRRYILELVSAAVALGAPSLEIQSNVGLEMRFGGSPLPREGLKSLDDYLLGAGDSPAERALAYLAIGVNAVRQLDPIKIIVETPAGLRMVLDGKRELFQPGEFHEHRIQVHFRRWKGEELELVRAECRFGSCPVLLDGQDVVQPVPDLWMEIRERRGGRLFRVGLDPVLETSALTLVSHGVVVGRKQPALELPLEAVVWDDDLHRNASHSDVVEDSGYTSLQEEIVGLGRRSAARLAGAYPDQVPPHRRARIRELLLALGASCPRDSELFAALADRPLLPTMSDEMVSLSQLAEQARELGEVAVSTRKMPGTSAGLRIVLVREAGVSALLGAVFGSRVVNVEERLAKELEAQGNRERWEARPRPSSLPPGTWLARRRIEDTGCQGEVGLDPRDHDSGSILHVLYQGKLLVTQQLEGMLSYVAVLDFQELEILPDWSGPAASQGFRSALLQLDQVARELYDRLDAPPAESGQPGFREHVLLRLQELTRQGAPLPPALRSARVFSEIRGLVSLETLEGFRPGKFSIGWVAPGTPALPGDLPPEVLPEDPVVRAGPVEQDILRRHFGRNRLRSFSKAYSALQELAGRFGQPEEPRLGPGLRAVVPFLDKNIRGELGLDLLQAAGKGQVRVLRRGIRLCTRQLDTPGPAYQAVIDCPGLTPDKAWTGFRDDEAWEEVRSALARTERASWLQLVQSVPAEPRGPERSAILQLVSIEPQMHPRLAKLRLFPLLEGAASAQELKEEMRRQGRVLVVQERAPVDPEYLVLLGVGPPELTALRALAPEVELADAGAFLAAKKAREEFQKRKVHRQIRLPGKPLDRQMLGAPFGGEVALGWSEAGHADYYLEGRRVWRRPQLLPASFAAAVESADFVPDALFTRVEAGPALEAADREVFRVVNSMARRLASQDSFAPGQAELVLKTLGWEHLEKETREALQSARCLFRLPRDRISLREVREATQAARHVPYVPLGVEGRPLTAPVVLSLPPHLIETVQRLLGKKLVDYTPRLEVEEAQRARLERGPSDLSHCLTRCQVDAPRAGLAGEIGVPAQDVHLGLVFLRDGVPVAHLRGGELAVSGRLQGEFQVNRRAEVQLSKEQARVVQEFTLQVYEQLADQYNRLGLQKPARTRLLEFLQVHRSQLGGSGTAAAVAAKIVTMPLIATLTGPNTSVQSLVEETQTQGVLLYAERRFLLAAPDRLLPLLPRGSVEHALCGELLGHKNLQAWKPELVPRVNLKAVTGRLGTAWDWGWSRLRQAGASAGQSLGRVGSRVVELFPAVPEPQAQPETREDPVEENLLRAVRREFNRFVRGRLANQSGSYFKELTWTWWALGPPVLWRRQQLILNGLHPSIRYARENFETDSACVVLLVVHILCQVNHQLESVTDEDEFRFLERLAETMRGAYPEG